MYSGACGVCIVEHVECVHSGSCGVCTVEHVECVQVEHVECVQVEPTTTHHRVCVYIRTYYVTTYVGMYMYVCSGFY